MSAKHTPGPLTVEIDERWPFDIVTRDALGNEVFRTRMASHSTRQKSPTDALSGKYMDENIREKCAAANQRAVADEVIRAAAPEMLAALELVQMSNGWRYLSPEAQSLINGVVTKAKGEA